MTAEEKFAVTLETTHLDGHVLNRLLAETQAIDSRGGNVVRGQVRELLMRLRSAIRDQVPDSPRWTVAPLHDRLLKAELLNKGVAVAEFATVACAERVAAVLNDQEPPA